MRTALAIVFGLALWVSSIIVCVQLGVLLNGTPNWRTAVMIGLLFIATQVISYVAFRYRVALQVCVGLLLCLTAAFLLLYSTVPMFWENAEAAQPGVYPITWRSSAAFLVLLAATQLISFAVFNGLSRRRRH
jgi:hypothetical protein